MPCSFTDGNWTKTEKPVPSHWVIWAFLSNWSDSEWRRPKRQKAWRAKTGQGWFGQICPTLSSEASKAKDPPHKNGTICNHHCEWGPTFLFPPEIKGNLPLKTAAIWTTRWSQDCKLIVLYLFFIFSWSLSNLILRTMLYYIKSCVKLFSTLFYTVFGLGVLPVFIRQIFWWCNKLKKLCYAMCMRDYIFAIQPSCGLAEWDVLWAERYKPIIDIWL